MQGLNSWQLRPAGLQLACATWFVLWPFAALADSRSEPAAPVDEVTVTATRIPERVDQVPAQVSVIHGEELRARNVTDLHGALALVAGVEAPPGGDTGPAGAVPSFWGLHEFDAFLLVVDGVPWGGAFNPSIPTLDLNNVERIEVLKGAAPVMYGATSFVGVIHVIHYAAGNAASQASVGAGSFGSIRGSFSTALPSMGAFEQSLAVDGEKLNFSDDREEIKKGQALYRLNGPFAGGTLRFDADVTLQRQVPPSPVVRDGLSLTTVTPLDANFNPSDGRIDENRYHAVLGYSRPVSLGTWETTASAAYSDIDDMRGFLRPDLVDDGSSANADSQNQGRRILDGYFDTHIASTPWLGLDLVYGADLLYGVAKQVSRNGEYYVPLSSAGPVPSTGTLHVDEINSVADRRTFIGQYVQADWKPDEFWDVVAGLRLNETIEHNASAHIDGFDPLADEAESASRSKTRLGATIGVSYRAWRAGAEEIVVFADYRNAFKPAAIDFGPDYTPGVLLPETAESFEAGIKGAFADGRLTYEAELFHMKFQNLVVQTTGPSGGPLLTNAGGERLRGGEIEARYRLAPGLNAGFSVAYHDARFTEGTASESGADVDLTGKHLTLSPRLLGSLGLIYAPSQGFGASVIANYVGRRFLDLENTAIADSYVTLDASAGYSFDRFRLSLSGANLTDERGPVTQSEFGDSSFYLLPARAVFVSVDAAL